MQTNDHHSLGIISFYTAIQTKVLQLTDQHWPCFKHRMGHSQEFVELFVILEKFQSWVYPLYESLCSPQLVQDIAQDTEGIVSKWATTHDILKMVDRCIQEMGTILGNVAGRINFDNLHLTVNLDCYHLSGVRYTATMLSGM